MESPEDPKEKGEHTSTGLAEARVRLLKLAMRKVKASAQKNNLTIDDEEIGFEAAMSHNMVLSYGGVTPAMAAMGMHPRGYYEFEDKAFTMIDAARHNSHDIFEGAGRLRMLAMAATQKAIIEDRFMQANNTKTQQFDSTLVKEKDESRSIDYQTRRTKKGMMSQWGQQCQQVSCNHGKGKLPLTR